MTDGVEVEFIARAIMLCDMATSAVVAVSRQLPVEATLLAERREAVTVAYARTIEKLNIHPLILPPGSAVKLQHLIASDASVGGLSEQLVAAEKRLISLDASVGGLSEQLVAAEKSAQNFERQASHFRQEAEVGHRPAEFPMLRTFINRYILADRQLSPLHTDAPTENSPIPIYHHAYDGHPDPYVA